MRYHVIYRVLFNIMYLARGLSDGVSFNKDLHFMKNSFNMLENSTKDEKIIKSNEYSEEYLENIDNTSSESKENCQFKQEYSNSKGPRDNENNSFKIFTNFDTFNKDYIKSTTSNKFDHYSSSFRSRDILSNNLFHEENSPQELNENYFNFEDIKLRKRKSNETGDHNFESEESLYKDDFFVSDSWLKESLNSVTTSMFASIFCFNDKKRIRRKRDSTNLLKQRLRKRRFRNFRSGKEIRRDPSRFERHQNIRLIIKLSNSIEKEISSKKTSKKATKQKNVNLVVSSNDELRKDDIQIWHVQEPDLLEENSEQHERNGAAKNTDQKTNSTTKKQAPSLSSEDNLLIPSDQLQSPIPSNIFIQNFVSDMENSERSLISNAEYKNWANNPVYQLGNYFLDLRPQGIQNLVLLKGNEPSKYLSYGNNFRNSNQNLISLKDSPILLKLPWLNNHANLPNYNRYNLSLENNPIIQVPMIGSNIQENSLQPQTKYNKSFQLLPVAQNHYVLKEDISKNVDLDRNSSQSSNTSQSALRINITEKNLTDFKNSDPYQFNGVNRPFSDIDLNPLVMANDNDLSLYNPYSSGSLTNGFSSPYYLYNHGIMYNHNFLNPHHLHNPVNHNLANLQGSSDTSLSSAKNNQNLLRTVPLSSRSFIDRKDRSQKEDGPKKNEDSINEKKHNFLNNINFSNVRVQSFSAVIEPLTVQLQKLLSIIKKVNENMTNGKVKDLEALEEKLENTKQKRRQARVKCGLTKDNDDKDDGKLGKTLGYKINRHTTNIEDMIPSTTLGEESFLYIKEVTPTMIPDVREIFSSNPRFDSSVTFHPTELDFLSDRKSSTVPDHQIVDYFNQDRDHDRDHNKSIIDFLKKVLLTKQSEFSKAIIETSKNHLKELPSTNNNENFLKSSVPSEIDIWLFQGNTIKIEFQEIMNETSRMQIESSAASVLGLKMIFIDETSSGIDSRFCNSETEIQPNINSSAILQIQNSSSKYNLNETEKSIFNDLDLKNPNNKIEDNLISNPKMMSDILKKLKTHDTNFSNIFSKIICKRSNLTFETDYDKNRKTDNLNSYQLGKNIYNRNKDESSDYNQNMTSIRIDRNKNIRENNDNSLFSIFRTENFMEKENKKKNCIRENNKMNKNPIKQTNISQLSTLGLKTQPKKKVTLSNKENERSRQKNKFTNKIKKRNDRRLISSDYKNQIKEYLDGDNSYDRFLKEKCNKTGYIRFGRTLKSFSGYKKMEIEFGKHRQEKEKFEKNSRIRMKRKLAMNEFSDQFIESDSYDETLSTTGVIKSITSYKDLIGLMGQEKYYSTTSKSRRQRNGPSTEEYDYDDSVPTTEKFLDEYGVDEGVSESGEATWYDYEEEETSFLPQKSTKEVSTSKKLKSLSKVSKTTKPVAVSSTEPSSTAKMKTKEMKSSKKTTALKTSEDSPKTTIAKTSKATTKASIASKSSVDAETQSSKTTIKSGSSEISLKANNTTTKIQITKKGKTVTIQKTTLTRKENIATKNTHRSPTTEFTLPFGMTTTEEMTKTTIKLPTVDITPIVIAITTEALKTSIKSNSADTTTNSITEVDTLITRISEKSSEVTSTAEDTTENETNKNSSTIADVTRSGLTFEMQTTPTAEAASEKSSDSENETTRSFTYSQIVESTESSSTVKVESTSESVSKSQSETESSSSSKVPSTVSGDLNQESVPASEKKATSEVETTEKVSTELSEATTQTTTELSSENIQLREKISTTSQILETISTPKGSEKPTEISSENTIEITTHADEIEEDKKKEISTESEENEDNTSTELKENEERTSVETKKEKENTSTDSEEEMEETPTESEEKKDNTSTDSEENEEITSVEPKKENTSTESEEEKQEILTESGEKTEKTTTESKEDKEETSPEAQEEKRTSTELGEAGNYDETYAVEYGKKTKDGEDDYENYDIDDNDEAQGSGDEISWEKYEDNYTGKPEEEDEKSDSTTEESTLEESTSSESLKEKETPTSSSDSEMETSHLPELTSKPDSRSTTERSTSKKSSSSEFLRKQNTATLKSLSIPKSESKALCTSKIKPETSSVSNLETETCTPEMNSKAVFYSTTEKSITNKISLCEYHEQNTTAISEIQSSCSTEAEGRTTARHETLILTEITPESSIGSTPMIDEESESDALRCLNVPGSEVSRSTDGATIPTNEGRTETSSTASERKTLKAGADEQKKQKELIAELTKAENELEKKGKELRRMENKIKEKKKLRLEQKNKKYDNWPRLQVIERKQKELEQKQTELHERLREVEKNVSKKKKGKKRKKVCANRLKSSNSKTTSNRKSKTNSKRLTRKLMILNDNSSEEIVYRDKLSVLRENFNLDSNDPTVNFGKVKKEDEVSYRFGDHEWRKDCIEDNEQFQISEFDSEEKKNVSKRTKRDSFKIFWNCVKLSYETTTFEKVQNEWKDNSCASKNKVSKGSTVSSSPERTTDRGYLNTKEIKMVIYKKCGNQKQAQAKKEMKLLWKNKDIETTDDYVTENEKEAANIVLKKRITTETKNISQEKDEYEDVDYVTMKSTEENDEESSDEYEDEKESSNWANYDRKRFRTTLKDDENLGAPAKFFLLNGNKEEELMSRTGHLLHVVDIVKEGIVKNEGCLKRRHQVSVKSNLVKRNTQGLKASEKRDSKDGYDEEKTYLRPNFDFKKETKPQHSININNRHFTNDNFEQPKYILNHFNDDPQFETKISTHHQENKQKRKMIEPRKRILNEEEDLKQEMNHKMKRSTTFMNIENINLEDNDEINQETLKKIEEEKEDGNEGDYEYDDKEDNKNDLDDLSVDEDFSGQDTRKTMGYVKALKHQWPIPKSLNSISNFTLKLKNLCKIELRNDGENDEDVEIKDEVTTFRYLRKKKTEVENQIERPFSRKQFSENYKNIDNENPETLQPKIERNSETTFRPEEEILKTSWEENTDNNLISSLHVKSVEDFLDKPNSRTREISYKFDENDHSEPNEKNKSSAGNLNDKFERATINEFTVESEVKKPELAKARATNASLNRAIKIAVDMVITKTLKILNDEATRTKIDSFENKFLERRHVQEEDFESSNIVDKKVEFKKRKENEDKRDGILSKRSKESHNKKKNKNNETSIISAEPKIYGLNSISNSTLVVETFKNDSSSKVKSNGTLETKTTSKDSTKLNNYLSTTGKTSANPMSSKRNPISNLSSEIVPIIFNAKRFLKTSTETALPRPYFICIPGLTDKLGVNKSALDPNINLFDISTKDLKSRNENQWQNLDVNYHGGNEDYETEYQGIADDERYSRSLLALNKVKHLNDLKNKKNHINGKDHKRRQFFKHNKYQNGKKNFQNAKSFNHKDNSRKSFHHSRRHRNEEFQTSINSGTTKKQLSDLEEGKFSGQAPLTKIKNLKIGEVESKMNDSSFIKIEDTNHLLDKIIKMINQKNQMKEKSPNLIFSQNNQKKNIIEDKKRLSRSIIDKVKEIIGRAIGYTKIPEENQTLKNNLIIGNEIQSTSRVRSIIINEENEFKKAFEDLKPTKSSYVISKSKSSFEEKNNLKNEENSNSKSLPLPIGYDEPSVHGLPKEEVNLQFSDQSIGEKKKVLKKQYQFFDLKKVISKVKELLKKQNSGKVEKIIVYVDKQEIRKNSKLGPNGVRNSAFSRTHSKVALDEATLNEIVSLVANKVIKSINSSSPSSSGSKVFVKVIQPVVHETEAPHEEIKSEFTFNLFKVNDNLQILQKPNQNSNPKNIFRKKQKAMQANMKESSHQNFSKFHRMIDMKNQQKMNLPAKPFKKRRYWYEKIDKEKGLNKKTLAEIRSDVLKALHKKLKDAEIEPHKRDLVRTKRKTYNEDLSQNSTRTEGNSKLKIDSFHENGFAKKKGLVSETKDSSYKLRLDLEKVVKKYTLKKKRMIQENLRKSNYSEDSGVEEDFSFYDELENPKLGSKIPLNYGEKLLESNYSQMNDYVVKNNHQSMFGAEDYDQEAKDFILYKGNNTILKNVSNNYFQNDHEPKIVKMTETNSFRQNFGIRKNEKNQNAENIFFTSTEVMELVSKIKSKISNRDTNQIDFKNLWNDDSKSKFILDLQKQLFQKSKYQSLNNPHKRITTGKFSKKIIENCENTTILKANDSSQPKENDKSCQKCNFFSDEYGENKIKELENIQQLDRKIQNIAMKILHFARELGSNKKRIERNGDFNEIVDKFVENELGLANENDIKAVRKLIEEIVNIERNVDTTLKIITKKLGQSSNVTSKINLTSKEEDNTKIWAVNQLKNILNQIERIDGNNFGIERARDEIKVALNDLVNDSDQFLRNKNSNFEDNVVKSHLISNSGILKNKKFDLKHRNQDENTPKVTKDKHPQSKKPQSKKKKKIHKIEKIKNKKKRHSHKFRPKNSKKKINTRDDHPTSEIKNLNYKSYNGEESNQDSSRQKLFRKDKLVEFEKPRFRFRRNVQNSKNTPRKSLVNIEKYQIRNVQSRKEIKKNLSEKIDQNILYNEFGRINSKRQFLKNSKENVRLKNRKKISSRNENFKKVDSENFETNEKPEDLQVRSIGRQLCNHKSSKNTKKSPQKIKKHNFNSNMKKSKKNKHKKKPKSSKKSKEIFNINTKSKSSGRIKKASLNSKIEEQNSKKEKYQSQTIIPIENGKILVKYIFRNGMNYSNNNRDIEVIDFEENRKDEKKRQENCENCICDLNQAVLDLRNMLKKRSNLLGRIETYECNLFTDIGNEIHISNRPIDALDQVRRNLEETRGFKYIESEKVEEVLKRGIVDSNENEIFSLPGFNLIVPCNHEGEDISWMMSISKPNYTWTHDYNSPISGIVRKNGNLELYDIDIKDTGEYSCVVSYIDPDNEEPIVNTYKHIVLVVTLPKYALRGGNRYKLELCDDTEIETILTYLPKRLNEILCKNDICEAYIFTPHCHRERIAINVLVVPSNIAKLVPVGLNFCGIRCRKAVQDKIALLLSRNVQTILRRPIIFRLPHHREKLVPVEFSKNNRRRKKGRKKKYRSIENVGDVGLLIGCPAGYNLRATHCLPCLPGFYSEDGSSHCKKCPLGTHQPNTGARICQACTNPFIEGCYGMIWNSSTAIIILAIIFVIVLTLSFVSCFCMKGTKKNKKNETCARSTEFESRKDDRAKQPLLKSKKKRKSPLNDREVIIFRPEAKKNGRDCLDKKPDKRGCVLVSCVDSYRSHESRNENSSTGKFSCYKPPVPEPDFDG